MPAIPNGNDLKAFQGQAVDLTPKTADAEVARLRAEQDARDAAAAQQAEVVSWIRNMRRTFKGIYSHPERLRALTAASRRAESAKS